MPQGFPPDSQQFQPEQQPLKVVEYWPTPFTPLRNDIASAGIPFTLRQPTGTAGDFQAALEGASHANLSSTFTSTPATTILTGGRLANLISFWAGGAPGYHGATVSRRVAYRFQLTMRSPSGRDWFSSSTTVSVALAVAGNGYMRAVKNPTGSSVELLGTTGVTLRESDYVLTGHTWSPVFTLTTGDVIDLYYVQDQTSWGGYVVKLVNTATVPDRERDRDLLVRDAPVIGCGLMDDGQSEQAALAKKTLTLITEVETNRDPTATSDATFQVPLANTQTWDGIGWEWVRTGGDESGFLRLHSFADAGGGTVAAVTQDVKRQRLVRVRLGFQQWDAGTELYRSFTGFTDDFTDPATGLVKVHCKGIEQRLADQFVKNYPDRISYMAYGFRKLQGTTEPVYDVPAYDNWPMELALRDMLVRAGIDESRTRAALTVPQADGTDVPVVM